MQATIDGSPRRPFLPFLKRFHRDLRAGVKEYTLRSRPYGKAGDVLNTDVGEVVLLGVRQERVGWVRDNLYEKEGCKTPDEFEVVWRSLHRGHFDPEQVRYLHHFRLRTTEEEEKRG